MELTDILSREEWARFEKENSDRYHVNCTGYDTEGGQVEDFLVQKTTGMDEREVSALCEGLRFITKDEAREVAATIAERISHIVTNAR